MAYAGILAVVKSSTVRNLATIMPKCTQLQNSLLTVVSRSVVTRTEAPCLRFLNDRRYTIDVAQAGERSKNTSDFKRFVYQFAYYDSRN